MAGHSDNARTQTVLTLTAAKRLANAAEQHAAGSARAMSIAIVDPGGKLIHLSRMDGAPLLSIDIAVNKAYTAVGFGMPTHAWYDFIKDDPPLSAGALNIDRLIVFGGGYPIVVDGELIGAIGVSGGHYTDDMEVAEAGLAAL